MVENLVQKLKDLTEAVLPSDEYFVVDVLLTGSRNHPKIEILLDGDKGVDIDVCSKVNRKVSSLLEEKQLMDFPFTLEVGSPGIDFPLSSVRQYKKNQGREVRVDCLDGKILQGRLILADENGISLLPVKAGKKETIKPVEVRISYSEIKKTKVIVSL